MAQGTTEDKPHIVIYNPKGAPSVLIDCRVVGDDYANTLVERFSKSGHTCKRITEREYQEIRQESRFYPF